MPAVILLAAVLALTAGPALPQSLSGLITVGPYIVLLLGVAISAWFNRGRALIMLASLLAAYAGYTLAVDVGPKTFAVKAVSTGARATTNGSRSTSRPTRSPATRVRTGARP